MSLIRFDARLDPRRDLDGLQRQVFGMLNTPTWFGLGRDNPEVTAWQPDVDVTETEHAYAIAAELPDVKKENVKVTFQEGVITLSGERRRETQDKGTRYHRVERSYGKFTRSFSLPESVDETAITAKFSDGVLHVTIPKAEPEAVKSKEIVVE